MGLAQWYKNGTYKFWVSDVYNAAHLQGPFPVQIVPGAGGATEITKAEDAPHASGDSGIEVLGVRNDAATTVLTSNNGDYSPIAVDDRGKVFVASASSATLGDAVANTSGGRFNTGGGAVFGIEVFETLFNGATWDRFRNNETGTALSSAARTVTTQSADIVNFNNKGILLFLNITVASGTGGLQTRIEAKDPVSSAYFGVGTLPTAVIATGLTVYAFYPGASAGYTNTVSGPVPRTFRVAVTVGDATSYTYSVGYSFIS